MKSHDVALSLQNIFYSYKVEGNPVPVLRGLTLDIKVGEFVAIQGPSGSGKSTLLYLLGCLLKPDSGSVTIAGRDVLSPSKDELALFRNQNIGFIFQQFYLLPRSSILENILLPTKYPSELKAGEIPSNSLIEKARSLAELVGLSERLHHTPSQLSGGQQQRVAIARALINDPKLILADEPTGNLDSKTSSGIIELLRDLNRKGRTIVIITHDSEVAKQCDRIIHIKDGAVIEDEQINNYVAPSSLAPTPTPKLSTKQSATQLFTYWRLFISLLPLAVDNLKRNRLRSVLTMLGVVIGVAAVMAMITLGQFTKRKILSSYAELGVNTFVFSGSENWRLKATDKFGVAFRYFDWQRDIVPLKSKFPEIKRLSPLYTSWNSKISYAGLKIESDATVIGVNEHALNMTQRRIQIGKNFSAYALENRSPVCLIGNEIATKLFQNTNPIGEVITVEGRDNAYGCIVLGVLAKSSSRKEWSKPNLQVVIPFTLFQNIGYSYWETELEGFLVEVHDGTNIEEIGKKIRAYYSLKYGKTGIFRADSDSVLIAQMQKFLTLFTIMLAAIALLSLLVGGIGIANMMLVAVNERYREIGLRKALGATDLSIRVQFITESIVVCGIAGLVGLLIGFITYESVIYGASYFVKQLEFEWTVDPYSLVFALGSIILVGIFSGLAPALKAEKLQVIEALRSE